MTGASTRGGSSSRRLISSGGPYEASVGYSRAVVVGDACWVAGTTDAGPDGRSRHPGDAGGQARAALDIIERALSEAGFALADVVRTRMYVTDAASIPTVLAAHGERFAAIRPASAIVVVAGLIEPSLSVEIEVDAHR
jgi:enamine deaminase RidA (YjgF/YER057c/UK114 family)